jgi:hypothetical protein
MSLKKSDMLTEGLLDALGKEEDHQENGGTLY